MLFGLPVDNIPLGLKAALAITRNDSQLCSTCHQKLAEWKDKEKMENVANIFKADELDVDSTDPSNEASTGTVVGIMSTSVDSTTAVAAEAEDVVAPQQDLSPKKGGGGGDDVVQGNEEMEMLADIALADEEEDRGKDAQQQQQNEEEKEEKAVEKEEEVVAVATDEGNNQKEEEEENPGSAEQEEEEAAVAAATAFSGEHKRKRLKRLKKISFLDIEAEEDNAENSEDGGGGGGGTSAVGTGEEEEEEEDDEQGNVDLDADLEGFTYPDDAPLIPLDDDEIKRLEGDLIAADPSDPHYELIYEETKQATKATIRDFLISVHLPKDSQRLIFDYLRSQKFLDDVFQKCFRRVKERLTNPVAVSLPSPIDVDAVDNGVQNSDATATVSPPAAAAIAGANKPIIVGRTVHEGDELGLSKTEVMIAASATAFHYVHKILFSNSLDRFAKYVNSDSEFRRILDRSKASVVKLREYIASRIKEFDLRQPPENSSNCGSFYGLLNAAVSAEDIYFNCLQPAAPLQEEDLIVNADKRIVIKTSLPTVECSLADLYLVTFVKDDNGQNKPSDGTSPIAGMYLYTKTYAWLVSLAHASVKLQTHVKMLMDGSSAQPYFAKWANAHKAELAEGKIKHLDFAKIHRHALEQVWEMWQSSYNRFLAVLKSAKELKKQL